MSTNSKLWREEISGPIHVKQKALDLRFDENSIVFGYTIRIPSNLYDNVTNCRKSSKLITEKQESQNTWCHQFRNSKGQCYINMTHRIKYSNVINFYSLQRSIFTQLKQECMILTRRLKALQLEGEQKSLNEGEQTFQMLKKQQRLWED